MLSALSDAELLPLLQGLQLTRHDLLGGFRCDEPGYDYSAGVYLVRLNMGEYSAGYPINGVSYDDCQVRLGRGSPGEATPLGCVCNGAFQPAELADVAQRVRSGELPDVGAVGAARARALVAARGVV